MGTRAKSGGMRRARHLARELALYIVFGAITLPLVFLVVYVIFWWFAFPLKPQQTC